MLIGRTKETNLLLQAQDQRDAQLIAVYGRRRIGKTYLIRETFGQMMTFQHAGVYGGNKKQQLKEFFISLKRAGLPQNTAMPADWFEAFELLRIVIMQSPRTRKILFIDELSWIDTPRSDFMMALENFWNGWASAQKNFLMILCSSATSWMLSKVIHNKGGLYNRLTGQIHLQPFSLADCSEFVTKKKLALQINQILELYMVIGGVPFYWNYVQKGFSTAQNVDHMFFEAEAPLKQEYDYLFSSLFRKPDDYLRIISVLAGKKSGLTRTDIAQKTGLSPSGNLTRKLEELESCGFIRVYNGYEKKKKDSLYQLIDPFVLFYHHFLVKAPRDPAFWSHQLNTPALNVWNGLAFELVCLLHIDQIKKAMGISMIHTDVFSFLCKSNQDEGIFGSQIDLVIWRADRIINLVEMKYSSGPYIITKKLYESMQKKLHDFLVSTGTRDSVHLTMVTVHGIEGNAFAEGIQSQITAKDLFSR